MKDWKEAFEEPKFDFEHNSVFENNSLAQTFLKNSKKIFEDNYDFDIAIFGILEDRNSKNNHGCANGANTIRSYLYRLTNKFQNLKLVDLGNLKKGNTIEDTYFAASEIIKILLENNIFPIIIGGSSDLIYANYLAYEKKGQIINLASIDSRIDISLNENQFDSESYLSKIILSKPNFLFNYTNIGHQTYFVDTNRIELMKQLFFDCYRLGDIRKEIEESEALVRNADMLGIDISSVRQSEAPGTFNTSPNGFYGEELCTIARYAGMSDKLSSAGIYEYNPILDKEGQTAHLIAQTIWFIIDGFANRKNDDPRIDKDNFLIFYVFNKQLDLDLKFYKSKKTNRWWMEVPYDSKNESKIKRHFLVACTQKDYNIAMNNELPDRWWQTYQKIM